MKRKNYKSAIHNFADSFQSIDWMKSSSLAMNVLVKLNNEGMQPVAVFDFINGSIEPKEARTKEGKGLLEDYLSWLPEHLKKHNCDRDILEALVIEVSAGIDEAVIPPGMSNCLEIVVKTKTNWKLKDEEPRELRKAQREIMKSQILRNGFPKFH